MATPKKSVTKASKGTRGRAATQAHVERVREPLAALHQQPDVDDSRTMKIVNSFVSDLFERIATEAATIVRVNRKRTLGDANYRQRCAWCWAGRPRQARNGGGHKAVSHASS
ncbi:hypothetical protein ERJ75_001685400 [Trypanosoma vivax]|nr:hypothetical protein ERJ75_001685400 [Trypanosoma vivax]